MSSNSYRRPVIPTHGTIERVTDHHVLPEDKAGDEKCSLCGRDFPFTMPDSLVDAAVHGRLVIFAGAGVSTEADYVFPESFYNEVRAELSSPPEDESFPGVMSAFQAEFGRLKLVEECIERLRYAETFPSVRTYASRFHRELATISAVREIITTNWDGFFEDECGAIPIVVDGDYAFYHLPDRKVYKIHGSIRNVSTLVATTEDYIEAESRLRSNAIGGTLRHLLATKVVVFAGFSLKDSDFQNVFNSLLASMGQLRPVAYFLSPFDSVEADEFGLRHIKTDGTHFLRSLKAHLVERGTLLPDQVLARASRLVGRVREAHEATVGDDCKNQEGLIFSLAYQDGLLDALNRINRRWITGEYNDPHHLHHLVATYARYLRIAIERRRYWDAAYVDGYANGLMLLLSEDEDAVTAIPLYEYFDPDIFLLGEPPEEPGQETEGEPPAGSVDEVDEPEEPNDSVEESGLDGEARLPELLSLEELRAFLEGVEDEIPGLRTEAEELRGIMQGGVVIQHTPFLDGLGDDAPRATAGAPPGQV